MNNSKDLQEIKTELVSIFRNHLGDDFMDDERIKYVDKYSEDVEEAIMDTSRASEDSSNIKYIIALKLFHKQKS